MIDAGRQITEDESGMEVKIYSENPWRETCGPQDDFEKRALEALKCRNFVSSDGQCASVNATRDERSYYEFGKVDGKPVLRYARAQIMKQSCVQCHNNDSSSPKRDWVIGEVGGVISITRPLQRDIESTRSGLRSAFNLIAVVAILLTGLMLAVVWTAKRQFVRNAEGASLDGND